MGTVPCCQSWSDSGKFVEQCDPARARISGNRFPCIRVTESPLALCDHLSAPLFPAVKDDQTPASLSDKNEAWTAGWRCLVWACSLTNRDLDLSIKFFRFVSFFFLNTLYNPFREIRAALPGWRLPQPQEQRYSFLQVYARSFSVSVIHRTLTWTTGSLTCVRDHSYGCEYTRRLGTPTSQHNSSDSEKLSQFLCRCSWRGSNLGSLDLESDAVPCSWATPSPLVRVQVNGLSF